MCVEDVANEETVGKVDSTHSQSGFFSLLHFFLHFFKSCSVDAKYCVGLMTVALSNLTHYVCDVLKNLHSLDFFRHFLHVCCE